MPDGADVKWASEAPTNEKFTPNQPRVPAGNRIGGQWTNGDGEAEASGDGDLHLVARKPGGLAKELWKLTVRQFVSRYCKGSINREFPGQFDDVTLGDIMDMAKGGDAAARKCHRLLNDNRFRK